jgi:hypothetical protein
MEPVSTALVVAAITAAASSAGNEAGRGVWGALTALSRRLARRDAPQPDTRPDDDPAQLAALADLLVERARADAEFAADLARWLADARCLPAPGEQVHNVISGSAQVSGPVVQAGNISGPITFGPTPPAAW